MNFYIILSKTKSIVSYVKIQAKNKESAVNLIANTSYEEKNILDKSDFSEITIGEYTECIDIFSDTPMDYLVTVESNGSINKYLCNEDKLKSFGETQQGFYISTQKIFN